MISLRPLTRFSQDLRQHLDVAISSLSTSSSTVPYVQCLDAQAAMVAALRLFASPLPIRPSPFFRLPSELVSHIVQFCQDEDLFVRQSTNLALSRTTRSLYRAVRPILRVEVHLFTAQQLERVSRNFKEHDFATSAIESLPVNLKLCQIKRPPDERWAGRLLFPLLSQYRAKESARVLHIHLAPSDSDGEIDEDEVFWQRQEEMMHALRFAGKSSANELRGWRFRILDELEMSFISGYSMYELVGFIADPPPFLQRLALGTGSEQFTHLKLPFFDFSPADFTSLLLPPTFSGPSALEHLEITFSIIDFQSDVGSLVNLLGRLPSLRDLSLRTK
ncbi:hypothetical protein JCM11641_000086 [Rhodosporidiobolus odoratus]